MDPIAKQILNTLKCPLCKARIDLLDWKDVSDGRKYNFCCSSNWEHYRNFFVHWQPVIYIEYETVVIYEGHRKYHLTQYDDNRTEIFIYDVDAENRIIDDKDKKKPVFRYDKKLFDFSNTNQEKIINRVKTILVFQ